MLGKHPRPPGNRPPAAATIGRAAGVKPAVKIEMTPSDVQQFTAFFYQRTGICFPEVKLPLVARQVSGVLNNLGFSSFDEALKTLKANASGADMQSVINALTINETYFYREEYQFELMVHHILPTITNSVRRGSNVRIWSLPCATGEEPYTIAIYLRENWPGTHIFNVEIFGSDIDTNVLKTAARAQYNQRSISRIPKHITSRYFRPSASGNMFSLDRGIADTVKLTNVNLLDKLQTMSMRNMDIIFCRNLLIYLDDASREKAVRHLYDCLKPGGFLLLGHSESLSWTTTMFETERRNGSALYRKPG